LWKKNQQHIVKIFYMWRGEHANHYATDVVPYFYFLFIIFLIKISYCPSIYYLKTKINPKSSMNKSCEKKNQQHIVKIFYMWMFCITLKERNTKRFVQNWQQKLIQNNKSYLISIYTLRVPTFVQTLFEYCNNPTA
jgi:hypothetical protein